MAHASNRSSLFHAETKPSHFVESYHSFADSPSQDFPRKKPRLTIDPMHSPK